MNLENQDQRRIQLNSDFQILVALVFLIVPIIFLTQMVNNFNKKDILAICIDLVILSITFLMAYRMKGLKRISFSPTQFYIRHLFKNDEIILPISCITSFKKAFTNLRHTDMFLIRYKDFDGQDKLVKIIRSRNDQSVITFTKLIELNQKNNNPIRGMVENKF
jgi:hypothetical protein